MSNQELNFDDGIFVFETVMRVRNTEIDMGQHLALQSLTALLTEADHQGLIINKLQLSIFSCVRAREELLFEVGVEPLCDNGGNIVFKAMRMHNGEIVAKARQHFVNYDFRLNKITTLDNTIKKALYPHLFEL